MERARNFGRRIIVETRMRRIAYAIAAVIFGVLCLLPRPYVARAKIVPQDTATSAGMSSVMTLLAGQSQSFASLLGGGKGSNDLYLIIGRSDSVAEQVISNLHLAGPSARYSTVDEAKIALSKKVDVHLLLGGVLEVETITHDRDESQRLTVAYVSAISKQLAAFGSQLIDNKQRIVKRRFEDAKRRVAQSEDALNGFRRANNLADPELELGSTLALRTGLQAELQAKEVQLQTLRQFQGPESPELRAVQTEIASLNAQIDRSATPTTTKGGPNVSGLSGLSTQYLTLYRNYRFAQSLYDIYVRSTEQVEVEELAAETASYIQVIDPAHLDAQRHVNTWAMGAFAAVILLAIFTEWYGPATGLLVPRRRPEDAGLDA